MARYRHRRSSTPGKVPVAGDFEAGEILVNTADGRLFVNTTSGVREIRNATDNDISYIKRLGDTIRGGLDLKHGTENTATWMMGFGWPDKHGRFGLDLSANGDIEFHAFDQDTGAWLRRVLTIGFDGKLTIGAEPTASTHAATKGYVDGPLNRLVTIPNTSNPNFDAQSGRTQVARLTATASRTVQAPSNPVDGQKVIIEHEASGGARTIGFATGAGAFDLRGKTIEATASGTTDFFGFIYSATANRWRLIAIDRPE